VSQHIEPQTFARRFSEIVQETYSNFFVECQIEFITDLRTFAAKLERLDGIYRVSAKLYPPNPIFGPLWKELKEYMEDRGADTFQLEEQSKDDTPMKTALPEHVIRASEQTESRPYAPKKPVPIGDASILMAADGYGTGLVEGNIHNESIIIRTKETVRNFRHSRDPDPKELYQKVAAMFEDIERQRHMKH
jgi:hypothetical protein